MSIRRIWICALLALVACSPGTDARKNIPSENTPPVANSQELTTTPGTPLAIVLSGSDADGDSLSFRVVDDPEHGKLEGEAPAFVYTPEPGFVGEDAFEFVVNDGQEDSKPATVSIQVRENEEPHVNTAPVADSQELHALQAQSLEITLTGSDADGDPLEFKVDDGPEYGELEGDGELRQYIPLPDFHGKDQFTFVVNDGSEASDPATVTIWVNGRPVAEDLQVVVNQGADIVIEPAGDDPEEEDLIFKIVKDPENGSLADVSEGWKYTPDSDFHGQDEFQYVANDGKQDSEPATVSIRVNARPIAEGLEVFVNQDSSVLIELEGSDPDEDVLSFSIFTNPSNGALVEEEEGWRYTPNAGFFGGDTFQYVANDGKQDSEPATVTIRVNAPPVAEDLEVFVNQDSSVLIEPEGSDPDGDVLSFSIFINPGDGSLVEEEDGWRYTPNAGFFGEDTFQYVANDGNMASKRATVSIRVNAPPVAEDLEILVNQDSSVLIEPEGSDPDGDVLSFSIFTNPGNGTLVDEEEGWRYTPNEGFFGKDSFEFVAQDGNLASEPATVSIRVNASPVAEDLEVFVNQGSSVVFDLLGSDPDGDDLTFNFPILKPIYNGTLVREDARWRYTPNPGFFGKDTYQYVANDGNSSSNFATLTIWVNAQPTVEVESSVVTVEDEPVVIPVQAKDWDDDPLTLVVLTQPSNGTLAIDPSDITYTPSEDFFGTDSFEFVANDGKMDSKPATVSVTVRSRPRVDDLAVNVLVNGQVSITPSGRSPEGNDVTFALVDGPSGDLDTSGPTWLYSPLGDFIGEDSFTYRAIDDEFGTESMPATVSITVHSESLQVSGFASGILSADAELMLNGDERIELSSDGVFQFTTPVFPGESYKVKLMAEPTKQLCYLENAEGTVSEEMLDVSLHCRSWKDPVNFTTGGHGFSNSGDLEITYNSLGDGLTVWTMGNAGTDPGANRTSTLWGAVYSAATGTWTPPSLISDDGSNVAVRNPQLLIADDGEKWVFWEQCDEFSTETEECGFSIRAAQMPAAGNSWSEPMVVRETQGEILQYGAAFSANSGQGRVLLVTYERDDKGTVEPSDDTYAVISVESGAPVGEWHEQIVDTFPHNHYIGLMFSLGDNEFLKLASYSGEVAALWTKGRQFSHSRYTDNGWTTPYIESGLVSASIGVAPNGDVLVIGRTNDYAGVTPGLLARWFRAPEDGEVGEKDWEPELETIYEHDWLTKASPLLRFAPDGSLMVVWGLRSPAKEGTVMAVRYTESSGWLPVQEVAYHNSSFSVVDMVRDWEGNAFLIMSKDVDSLVLQYSKTSDSWEGISLETGNGDDYVIAPQPDGKVTVLFRDKNDGNRARTVRFD